MSASWTVIQNGKILANQVDAKRDTIKAKLDSGDIVDWAGCVAEFGAE